ncbi:MAG: CAP domain-containing protein [Rubricoccaceae bacterium]|nr:CAP domain-containing protein [Rubricoccaceae bacterium]
MTLAALAGCVVPGVGRPAAPPDRTSTPRPPDYDAGRLEALTFAEANEARMAQGLLPLRPHDGLTVAARRHSDDLALHGLFSHTGTDGSVAADRVERLGIPYRALGENLYQSSLFASGYEQRRADGRIVSHYDWLAPETLAAQAVQAWLDSPGHRENLLSPAFGRAGVGVARDGDLGWVVTMVYAD